MFKVVTTLVLSFLIESSFLQAMRTTKKAYMGSNFTHLDCADPGVASSIPARSHTFVEIDHELISTVILLPSAESFKKGCCQLQAKVCARSTG